MAPISVTKTIKESYDLILEHWKDVAAPLIILLLISGGGQFGGKSFSPGSLNSGSRDYSPDSLATNAMTDMGPLLAMGTIVFVLIGLVAVFVIIMAILNQSTWFYTYEHFHMLLTKRKITEDWKPRMERHVLKAFFYELFNLVLVLVFIAVPIAIILLVPGLFVLDPAADIMVKLSSILPAIMIFVIFLFLLLALQFFLVPMWVYYAMDRLPLFESVGKAFSLVRDNLWLFVRFVGIFFSIGTAAAIGLIMLCCFSFILSPLVHVFLTLLSGVTLMKLKLAVEEGMPGIVKKA